MREVMTKNMARNIFYGGSLFFIIIFVGLTAHSHLYILNTSSNNDQLSESVAKGKHVWEKHACINCHSIMGEGAYFAPELMNVMTRWGMSGDAEGGYEVLDGWMKSQPSGVEGRRQMPYFELTEEETRNLADFLLWVDQIDAQGWPPNDAG
ncbi:c-type cytochrome [Paracoccus salsus]|uniref:c-type cytochrome n=1 Tax=Paracoccus salsus TaxID=2911061 RepID=UPI001F2FDC53|nr:cytochrome c [Paracoccus salsus]MCF3973532.1 cytochrome c [Paracoccus salsus]